MPSTRTFGQAWARRTNSRSASRYFEPYQVNEQLLAKTGKPTYFMHCLPAHRGQEVTDAVIEAEYSLVFQQAANRLPVEKAILIAMMEGNYEESQ